MHQSKGQSQFHNVKLLSHLSLTYDMIYWGKNGKQIDLKFGSDDHDLPYCIMISCEWNWSESGRCLKFLRDTGKKNLSHHFDRTPIGIVLCS